MRIAFAAAALALSPFVSPFVSIARAEDPHPFSVMDMLAMERISDPALSPDGKWVAFTLRTTDLDANKGKFDVWIAAVDGSKIERMTTHDAADTSPRWSSDGKELFFLSTRSGSSQIWRIAIGGGEPRAVTSLPLDVGGFIPFADGKRFVLALDVYPDAKTLDETVKRDAEFEKRKTSARVYDQLFFRHWDTWEDKKRSHVFVWQEGASEPIDLMKGMDADSPTPPFGGTEELAISPDGSTVVFGCKNVGREAAWSTNVDLFAAPSDGSKPARNLTAANQALDDTPAFSPDGKTLAYLAMKRPTFESDRQGVMLMDFASGKVREIAADWDRSATELEWSRDGKTLFTTADNLGQKSLFAIDVASGKVSTLVEKGTCGNPMSTGSRVVFLHDTFSSPAELKSVALDGSDVKPITAINAKKIAAAKLGDYEQFQFKGAKNDNVYAYLIKPIDFDASKKYPIAFLIHGGPQGSFGNHFHYRWNAEAYAGAGYAAILVDFHASTGYGQAFSDAIRDDWGGAPYEDLMKGLDAALAKYSFLDGNRCAALGASYGGYMINWIAGHTDRFKALVCHDGNLDERMAYFDTEELWFPEWEHKGLPWENEAGYTKATPIDFVQNWKTPELVIHGGRDYRVVDTQGMATFTALQRRGIPSKFIYFPDENHWVLKPQNSKFWHEQVLAWIDQWCKK